MYEVEEWTQFILGLALLIAIKLAVLHYTLRFINWWKGKENPKEDTNKCHDIYEYNFLDEYESDSDAQPDSLNFSVGESNIDNGKHSQSESSRLCPSKLQTAAKHLLTTIRNRRERTAAAMLNASLLSSTETGVTSGSNGVPDSNNTKRSQNPQEFLHSSKYYAFLQEILKEKNS
ncbi:unnamed protein product [Allacma fusca]|uniref:Uncharacterized protein n=1 Tax=Allacma fusca TaxID=39272 RepID=A0A8J2LR51_9HEXA|nr:unnamed protein product [Allacma fusca]